MTILSETRPVDSRPRNQLTLKCTILAIFYLGACGLSWWALHQAEATPAGPERTFLHPYLLLAKFAPSLTGLALLPLVWRFAWLPARTTRTIQDRVIYLVVAGLAFPFSVTFGAIEAASLLGHAQYTFQPQHLLDALGWISLRTFAGGGLGEEFGFRALALPLLLSVMGPRKVSLLVGIAWGFWHLPILLDKPALLWVGQFALTVSLSFVFTFLFVRTGGQLTLMVLLHGAVNGWEAFFSATLAQPYQADITWQVIRLAAFALIAVALCFVRWEGIDLYRTPGSAALNPDP